MIGKATAARRGWPHLVIGACAFAAASALALPAPSASAAEAAACPPPSTATAPSTITAAERNTILQMHNQARAATGAAPALAPLTWDSSMANAAQGWANIIGPSGNSSCHSGAQASGQGENLADWGTVAAGVQYWYNEKPSYHYPDPVAAGGRYLHYTQMVWRATQRIGCGKAPSKRFPGNVVLVCRYSPAGNFFGRPPY